MNRQCPKCGKLVQIVGYGGDYIIVGCVNHREFDEVIYDSLININITEGDVWRLAEKLHVKVPEEKKGEVIRTAKKFLESYCFDGVYNIWDALKDAIKTALEK